VRSFSFFLSFNKTAVFILFFFEISIQRITEFLDEGQFLEAEKLSLELIYITLEGLYYMHTYDRRFMMFLVLMGYCGWMVYVTSVVSL
jgi:hypothetical protein